MELCLGTIEHRLDLTYDASIKMRRLALFGPYRLPERLAATNRSRSRLASGIGNDINSDTPNQPRFVRIHVTFNPLARQGETRRSHPRTVSPIQYLAASS